MKRKPFWLLHFGLVLLKLFEPHASFAIVSTYFVRFLLFCLKKTKSQPHSNIVLNIMVHCKQKQVELKFRNKSSLQVLTPLSEYLYKNIFKIFKMTSEQKIVIVGSGLVGKSWAMIFASRGHPVLKLLISPHFNTAIMHFRASLSRIS